MRAPGGDPTALRPERIELDLPLYVERMGKGDPVIFLHGFGAWRVTFQQWARELSRRHTVYLVDLRGFGSASRPKPPRFGPGDMADDVFRMILGLDLREVTIIGHSMGGGVALLTALRLQDAGEGDRLVRLVSVAGTAYEQKVPHYVGMLRNAWAQWLLQLAPTRRVIRGVLQSIVYDPACITEEQIDAYTKPLRPWAAKRAAVACALQLIPEGLDELTLRYPSIKVPTLILWGRHDPVVPLAVGERLARELPNARLVVLERCGHDVPEEQPEESLRVLKEFLGVRA